MNYKLRLIIVDMIGILQRFVAAYCIITIFLYQTNKAAAIYSLCLIPIPFLSYLIQSKTKHIWSFITLHSLMLPVWLLASNSLDAAILFTLYIILTSVITYYTKNDRDISSNTYLIVVFIMFYLGLAAAKNFYLADLTFWLAVLFILLHFLSRYLYNYVKYFQAHASITNIPYSQIRSSNNVLVMFLGLLILLLLLIASGLPLNELFMHLGQFLLQLIRPLILLLLKDEPEEGTESFDITTEYNEVEVAEDSPLLLIIYKVIEWLLFILAAIALIILITYFIYKLYRYFYKRSKNEAADYVEFLSPFAKKEASNKASSRSSMKIFGHSNNAKIRKLFYKSVSSSVKDSTALSKNLTPSELTKLLDLGALSEATGAYDEQRKQITEYYEKARYSNLDCSKEDVKQIKQLLS